MLGISWDQEKDFCFLYKYSHGCEFWVMSKHRKKYIYRINYGKEKHILRKKNEEEKWLDNVSHVQGRELDFFIVELKLKLKSKVRTYWTSMQNPKQAKDLKMWPWGRDLTNEVLISVNYQI